MLRNMRWKNIIYLCITVLAAWTVLSGCSSKANNLFKNTTSAADDDMDVLTFSIVYADGDRAHKQGITTIISDFERSHPNISISAINETWTGSYAGFLKMKEAVGELPDLIEMRDTQLFADADLLQELPEDLIALFNTTFDVNGAIYTAPLEATAPQGIIYNKKILRQAGMAVPPKSMDEFLQYCEKIKGMGIDPIVVGGKDLWHMGFWINKFLIDEVYIHNPDWNSDRSAGKVSWTDPGPTNAITELKLLWDNGYVAPGFLVTADNQTVSMLLSGEVAMLYSGPWMFSQISSADPTFEYGFLLFLIGMAA